MFGLFYEVLHWAVPNAHTGLPAPPHHPPLYHPSIQQLPKLSTNPHTLSISQTTAIVTWKCKFMMWFFDLLELIATQVAGEGGSTNRQECYQARAQQRQFITNQQWFISRSACRLPVASLILLFFIFCFSVNLPHDCACKPPLHDKAQGLFSFHQTMHWKKISSLLISSR